MNDRRRTLRTASRLLARALRFASRYLLLPLLLAFAVYSVVWSGRGYDYFLLGFITCIALHAFLSWLLDL